MLFFLNMKATFLTQISLPSIQSRKRRFDQQAFGFRADTNIIPPKINVQINQTTNWGLHSNTFLFLCNFKLFCIDLQFMDFVHLFLWCCKRFILRPATFLHGTTKYLKRKLPLWSNTQHPNNE